LYGYPLLGIRRFHLSGPNPCPTLGVQRSPLQRHRGEDIALLARRDALYQAARAANPARWLGPTRNWKSTAKVFLNKDPSFPSMSVLHVLCPSGSSDGRGIVAEFCDNDGTGIPKCRHHPRLHGPIHLLAKEVRKGFHQSAAQH